MRSTSFVLVASFAIGCGGGGGGGGGALDDLDESPGTAEDMQRWLDDASAPALYAQAILPLAVAGFSGDTACPVVVETDTSTTYDGGCTDTDGNEWIGHAEANGAAMSGTGQIVYDGFGFVGEVDGCVGMRGTMTWNGVVDQTLNDDGSLTVDIDLRLDGDSFDADAGCAALVATYGVDYRLTMVEEGADRDIFSGSGRVGNSQDGVVAVETEDEVIDDAVCGDEALSGRTTIAASGHTAVVTYDGATDCDTTSTVTWTYDGADQGEVEGVSCAAGGSGGGAASLLLIGLALVGVRRRRR
jgi:MYXO-CTERM domain-containing protein